MSLLERLPSVRGSLKEDVSLAPYSWLRVGGPAEVFFMPKDEADLAHFLSSTPAMFLFRFWGSRPIH